MSATTTSASSAINGATVPIPHQPTNPDNALDMFDATTLPEYQEYRPQSPDIEELFREIARSMSFIVGQAFHKAEMFMSFAQRYDKDAPAYIRANHMADMDDCLAIARVYMRLWQEAITCQHPTADERFTLTDKQF